MNPTQQDSAADAALLQQQDLLETSLPAAFSAYDMAEKQKMVLPVVFLLDCEDEIGNEIALGWLGAQAVSDAIEQRQSLASEDDDNSDETTTVFAYAFPFDQCCAEVPNVFPYLAPVFTEKYPANGFLVIAVTAGGASALTVPFDARESDNK